MDGDKDKSYYFWDYSIYFSGYIVYPGASFLLEGSGFSETPGNNKVTIGGAVCQILSSTSSEITCMVGETPNVKFLTRYLVEVNVQGR